MADFSKQWAEIYDTEFPWDFDIEAEAETIPKVIINQLYVKDLDS